MLVRALLLTIVCGCAGWLAMRVLGGVLGGRWWGL